MSMLLGYTRSLFFLFICSLLVFLSIGMVSAKTIPRPTDFVTDCCQLLSVEEKNTINATLSKFQQETSTQVAVAVVKSLEGNNIESYATELFRSWGLGTKEKNNGVLLLFALEEKKIRIEVGYGLEGALPDILAGRIIRDEITPLMKQSRYGDAIINGTNAIIFATQGEYTISSPSLYKKSIDEAIPDDVGGMVSAFLGLLFVLGNSLVYTVSYMARSKSIWAGGVGGGFIGVVLIFIFGFGVITAVAAGILIIIGFILDAVLSWNYSSLKSQGKSTNFWDTSGGFSTFYSGSSSSDYSSSSDSFGGFGGGSSGGGGASGGW